MPNYSADAIRSDLANLPEDDSARKAMRKASMLAATPSSDLHDLHAAAYDALTEGAFSAACEAGNTEKVVQIVLSLHGAVQRSLLNTGREQYRGRNVASLRRGAETLAAGLAGVADDAPGAIRRRVATATSTAKPAATKPAGKQATKPAGKQATKPAATKPAATKPAATK